MVRSERSAALSISCSINNFSSLLSPSRHQICELGSRCISQYQWIPNLDYFPFIHHNNSIKVHDHIQPVAYGNDSVSLELGPDGLAYDAFRVNVNT